RDAPCGSANGSPLRSAEWCGRSWLLLQSGEHVCTPLLSAHLGGLVVLADVLAHLVEFAPRRIPLGLGLLHALDQGAHDAARPGFAIPCRVAVRESSGFVQQVVAHDSSSGSYSTRNGAYRK